MSLQKVPVNNFRGGLNTRDGPFDLQPNESPDLLNVTISNLVGQLETRKGKERYDQLGLPNESVDHSKQVVLGAAGKRFLMLSINGGIYYSTPTGEIKKLHAGTAASVWDFEVYADAAGKDWVYMGNGVDEMQKWDGEAAATVNWTATKGTIPKGGIVRVWENRLFITYVGTAPQRVYFSEFADPEATIGEYGFVDIRGQEEDLDAVQDLCVLGARLIVLKRRGVFFISSPVTLLNRHIGGPGVWGRFMCAELESKVYFFNPQGIFATAGPTVSMESGSINNWFPKYLNQTELEKARLIATKDTYPRLLLAVATESSASNDKLIEMVPHINFRRIGGRRYLLLPAFMIHSIPATSLACWNPTGHEELLVASSPGAAAPEPAIRDNFQTAENPFAKAGWGALSAQGFPTTNKGQVGKWQGGELVWQHIAEGEVGEKEGARWNTEYTNPEVSVEIRELTIGGVEGENGVVLLTCMNAGGDKGYAVRFSYESGTKLTHVEVFKNVTGITEPLKTFFIAANLKTKGAKIAVVVKEGKIKPWIFLPSSGWNLVGEVADSTYTKGFTGFQSNGVFTTLRNFGAEAAPTAVAKLYSIFKGTTDDGLPIQAHWKSSWIAIQEQEPKERVRRLNVELSGDAVVDVFKDFEENPAFTATLPREGERKEYGEPSTTGLAYRFTRVRPETHGRFHQIQFRTDAEGLPFQINAAELAIRGGKEH